jgi:hypothetical protein
MKKNDDSAKSQLPLATQLLQKPMADLNLPKFGPQCRARLTIKKRVRLRKNWAYALFTLGLLSLMGAVLPWYAGAGAMSILLCVSLGFNAVAGYLQYSADKLKVKLNHELSLKSAVPKALQTIDEILQQSITANPKSLPQLSRRLQRTHSLFQTPIKPHLPIDNCQACKSHSSPNLSRDSFFFAEDSGMATHVTPQELHSILSRQTVPSCTKRHKAFR